MKLSTISISWGFLFLILMSAEWSWHQCSCFVDITKYSDEAFAGNCVNFRLQKDGYDHMNSDYSSWFFEWILFMFF